MIYKFHSRHREIGEELRRELKHGDRSVPQRLAHTMKGVAGTLGAKKLSEISAELESAIKNHGNDRIPDLLDIFDKEVLRVMAALGAFIKREDEKEKEGTPDGGGIESENQEALDTHHAIELFKELSNLIDERDADVIKRVADIKTVLGQSHCSDTFLKLEAQLNCFNFVEAKRTLRKIEEELDL